jgi:hypothetical protein
MITTRKISWTMHVERVAGRGMHIDYWLESQNERDHYEDQGVSGRIILRRILERQDRVVWTIVIWPRIGAS